MQFSTIKLTLAFSFFVFLNKMMYAQKLAGCIEVLGHDSLKFYYNSYGLTNKECAKYFRIAKMSRQGYYFNGHSKDYYINGTLATESFFSNNTLDGDYVSYYENGKIKEKGKYSVGVKIGEWKYWFKNGDLFKVIIFSPSNYFVKELYRPNGKQIVKDGNGEYYDKSTMPQFIIKGEIKDGKQNGKWSLVNEEFNSTTCIELFENGKFIEGRNIGVDVQNEYYYDFPYTIIDNTIDLIGNAHLQKEKCNLSDFTQKPTFNSRTSSFPFLNYIYKSFNPSLNEKGYIIVSYEIENNGKVENVVCYSSLNDSTARNELTTIIKASDKWRIRERNSGTGKNAELLVIQFFDGYYKILSDSRNDYSFLKKSAVYEQGLNNFISFVEKSIILPEFFRGNKFSLSTTISFMINENGNLSIDNSTFETLISVENDERVLYNALTDVLIKTEFNWKPAMGFQKNEPHFFLGIFDIKNGKLSFRLLSNNWIVN